MNGSAKDLPRKDRHDAEQADAPDMLMDLVERQQPGCKAVNPALIPLSHGSLRDGGGRLDAVGSQATPGKATRKPARGIFVAVLLSLPFWSVVAVLVAWLRR